MATDQRPEFDPFLPALRGERAPETLTERDVAAHLQVSVDLLQKWRRHGTRPPHWNHVHGKLVRYPTRLFVEWLDELARSAPTSTNSSTPVEAIAAVVPVGDDGLDEPVLRGGRRKKTRHTAFSTFITSAFPGDEWLFVLRGPWQRPVDYLASFEGERSDDDEVVWLTLRDYLDRVRHAAAAEEAAALRGSLGDVIPETGKGRGP